MKIRNALPNGPLGFGGAPLGNMFRNSPEDEALAAVDGEHGTCYFDTAPFYGAGLSEIRMGKSLAKRNRAEYVLSTRVGRLILDEAETQGRDFGEKTGIFGFGLQNKIACDYSEDGAYRSIEDSLKRMNVGHIDFVWVHDLAQDFHGDSWLAEFETARTGAFQALSRMRDEGVIKGWGLGVNRVEAVEVLQNFEEIKPDGALLAGRYTVLDHERALQRLMPTAAKNGLDIVIGGPYSSGILAGGTHFEYQQATPEIVEKAERIKTVAQHYGVPIKAAALQFSLAHPVSAAVVREPVIRSALMKIMLR